MGWYIAKLVYQIICGDGRHTPQFDEQLRLIESADDLDAFRQATDMGHDGGDIFYSHEGKKVQWKFINVSELRNIGRPMNGTELHSRIQETDDAAQYIALTQSKAAQLRSNVSRKQKELI